MATSPTSPTSPQRLKGILSVTVVRAKNLIKADWFSQNDTYAVISLHPFEDEKKKRKTKEEKQQTETYQMTQVHVGSNPIFNEKVCISCTTKIRRNIRPIMGCRS